MNKTASQYRTNFWKHAKTYGKQIEVEELYNKWSVANHFSKDLSAQVKSLIQSDISNIKKAIQMTSEEFNDIISQNKGMGADISTPSLDPSLSSNPLEPDTDDLGMGSDLDSALDNTLGGSSMGQEDNTIPSSEIDAKPTQKVLPDEINPDGSNL